MKNDFPPNFMIYGIGLSTDDACRCPETLLAERCNFIAMSVYCHIMLSVCRLSVTRVYCDKITEVRITRFSHKSSVRP